MGIPIKNWSEQEFLRAYKEVYDDLENKGFKPKFHKLDNESSNEIQKCIASRNTDVQFAPPDMHRQNAAECAVCTWKNHFIAILASVNPMFPIANWCRLIPQANITLELM
jgi:hypothetical protein